MKFPYEATSVIANKKKVFSSINDVYDEIVQLYNISEEKGFEIGESLYYQCAFFTDYELLIVPKYQNRIKEYNYCKAFSCPPYPSMQQTPAEIVDDFMIIEHEYNQIINKNSKG